MTDLDERITQQLAHLMEVTAPVEPEEAMLRAGESRAITLGRRPVRHVGSWVRALLIVTAVVLVVVVVVIVRANSRTTGKPATKPPFRSVVVVNPCCGGATAPGGYTAVAVDVMTGARVPLPSLPGGIEDYMLTPAGSSIFAVQRTHGGVGPAFVFKVGSTRLTSVGNATIGYVGSLPDSAWLLTDESKTAHHVVTPTRCTLRLVSGSGRLLVRPTTVPCRWGVWGGVREGVVVGTLGGLKLWTPPGWRKSNVSSKVSAGTILASGTTIALFAGDAVTLIDSATGGVRRLSIRPPRAQSIVAESRLLSPDGRYLAYVTIPSSLPDQPIYPPGISGPTPFTTPVQVSGHLILVATSTGRVRLSRSVKVLVSARVPTAWSANGDYLFFPSSLSTVAAVPTFSATAPIGSVAIPPVSKELGFFQEGLLVAMKP